MLLKDYLENYMKGRTKEQLEYEAKELSKIIASGDMQSNNCIFIACGRDLEKLKLCINTFYQECNNRLFKLASIQEEVRQYSLPGEYEENLKNRLKIEKLI
ncbi:MAG: hypothetical protein ACRDD7_08340 [Peptostreptococcaceae bacterium]